MTVPQPLPDRRTLNHAIGCVGIGWHTRARVALTLHPAEPGSGICLRRTDRAASFSVCPMIAVTTAGVALVGANGTRIASIEHLLAALALCEVDDVLIEVSGPELPALDGSAAPFVRLIECVGVRGIDRPPPVLELLTPVQEAEGAALARLEPAAGLGLDVVVEHDATPIGRQRLVLNGPINAWRHDLAAARCHCHEDDLADLRAKGSARGATFANTVVVGADRIDAQNGPRGEDECVRHAALDALGDLKLLGVRLQAAYIGRRDDHTLRLRLLRRLMATPAAWRLHGHEVRAPAWTRAAV